MAKTSPVTCSHESCREQAAYKIAARWTDGRLAELKTYGFACSEHLGNIFREPLDRQQHYTPGPAKRSRSWRFTATSPENATASCNDCGGWKRTTVPDGRLCEPHPRRPTRQSGRSSTVRFRSYAAPPLRTERLAQPSRGVLRLDFRRVRLSLTRTERRYKGRSSWFRDQRKCSQEQGRWLTIGRPKSCRGSIGSQGFCPARRSRR